MPPDAKVCTNAQKVFHTMGCYNESFNHLEFH